MVAINRSIGRFVALANLEKDIFSQRSIEQNVADLVDLITIRIKGKSVDEVANGLLENIFDLRFDVIEWLAHIDKDLNFYLDFLSKHISVNLQLAPFSNLAEAISSVLLVYQKIVSPIFGTLPNSFKDILDEIQKSRPEYSTFKIFSLHPSPQIRYLKNWIDSSLQLEVGIILADLILTNQISISKKRIESELIEFLYDTITRFGGYSIYTGFWSPDTEDVSNLTNRMKILSATLELDNKSFYKISKEGFFEMVNN
ncbi:MAG: hypothetical protein AAGG68_06505 [Bacteroidota bacterium]